MKNRFSFHLSPVQMAYILICFLTLLQGFYNSLRYGFADRVMNRYCTFLFAPEDLNSDLIKPTLAMPPFAAPDMTNWSDRYKSYYARNAYGSPDLTQDTYVDAVRPMAGFFSSRHFTCLHETPSTLFVRLLLKRLILKFSPETIVYVYDVICVIAIGLICLLARGGSIYDDWLAFFVLVLSYPFLMIVSRGNFSALIVAMSLILYLYEVCRGKNLVWACACLVVACNFRPNAILLFPLVLCLTRNWFVLGWACAGVVGAITGCILVGTQIDGLLYPGYSMKAFLDALDTYNFYYVIGEAGEQFNNSAYGCFKVFIHIFNGRDLISLSPFLEMVSTLCLLTFSVSIIAAAFLYFDRRITKTHFAYMAVVGYVLATPVCATYHMLVFVAFLFVLAQEANIRVLRRADFAVLAGVVFILVPKNYFFFQDIGPDYDFFNDISLEVVLNPLILLATILYVGFGPKKDSFLFNQDAQTLPG